MLKLHKLNFWLALGYSLVFLNSSASALEGVNECAILEQNIAENLARLSLDEPDWQYYESHGIEAEYEEVGKYYIGKIYPEARWAFENEDLSLAEIEGKYIRSLNGAEVSTLSDEQFWHEWSKDNVKILVEGSETAYNFNSTEIEHLQVLVSLDLDRISRIDSKNSEFETKFRVRIIWTDNRLRSFFKNILEGAGYNPAKESFICDFEKELLQSYDFFLPEIRIPQFSSFVRPQSSEIELEYFPPSSSVDDDSVDVKNNGEVQLSYYIYFDGKITDEFFLEKFPFDTQPLYIEIYPKNSAAAGEFLDLTLSSLGELALEEDLYNIENAEWKLNNTYSKYEHYYYKDADVRNPHVIYVYEFERQSHYYVYKIYLPILFLLVVSWSVFWINPKDLESRSTIGIVCFLSLIAYNFVIDEDLPRVGYLTLMDRSVLISYLFSALPTIQSVFAKYALERGREHLAHRLDKEFRIYFFPSVIVAMTALFIEYGVLILPD